MKELSTVEVTAGPYKGLLSSRYNVPEVLKVLEVLGESMSGPDAEVVSDGRNKNVKLTLEVGGRRLCLFVKSFGRRSILQDLHDGMQGGKAERSWRVAKAMFEKGVGTPFPVAYLQRCSGVRFLESFYISECESESVTFAAELIRLYRKDPLCSRIMELMKCVAEAIGNMHDSGLMHNDLGNQNILLSRTGAVGWGNVQFVDLNRASIKTSLSIKERARDISRIHLPSDLLRVFKEMYHRGVQPLQEFHDWEKFYRDLYAFHSMTRNVRHPIRSLRKLGEPQNKSLDNVYPDARDIWIWDDRSCQAIGSLVSKDRKKLYPKRDLFRIASAVTGSILPVRREYKALLSACYKEHVTMNNRVGVAIDTASHRFERELPLLEGLGKIPVFVRFLHSESEREWDYSVEVVKDLHKRGHEVSIGFLQDRQAVKNPEKWNAFMDRILAGVSGSIRDAEIGHAVNRVKWGIWSLNDYRKMLTGLAVLAEKYPDINLVGPAGIDFEYPYVMAALKMLPAGGRFSALSHHLYVDRRGAPENMQGSFSALEKFALARAIARCSSSCDDRLVVSEVNWPIKGTGVYSPVGSPYESPGPRTGDPSVTEDEYADYMVRYLLTAICSGLVDRVFWWRLTARGFGLVDDSDDTKWRERSAYTELKSFLEKTSDTVFQKYVQDGDARVFEFADSNGKVVCAGYRSGNEKRSDKLGLPDDVVLSGKPVYFSR